MMLRRFWSRLKQSENAMDLAWAIGLTSTAAIMFHYRDHIVKRNKKIRLHEQHSENNVRLSATPQLINDRNIIAQVQNIDQQAEAPPNELWLKVQNSDLQNIQYVQEESKREQEVDETTAKSVVFSQHQPKDTKTHKITYVSQFTFSRELFTNDVLIYQTTGIKQLDERLIQILEIYSQKFHRQNLKIFVLERPQPSLQAPPHFMLMRKYTTKPIPLDLIRLQENAQSIEHFYSKVIKQIQKKWINTQTIRESANLSKLISDKDMLVILKANERDGNYLKKRVELEQMRRQLCGQKEFIIVDQDINGLQTAPHGQISIIVPSDSQNLKCPDELPQIFLGGRSHRVIVANSKTTITNNFIFWPLQLPKTDYHLQLLVNMNKLTRLQYLQLTKLVKEADLKIPILLVKTNDVAMYELTLVKKDPQWLINQKIQEVQLQQRQIEARKPRLWIFPQIHKLKQFPQWFSRVQINMEQPYYRSQKQSEYQRSSSKLIGSTFSEMLKDNTDSVIYFYSSHCGTCKRLGSQFEEVAKQKSSDVLHFYNINTDKNKLKEGFNFGYTPIFMFMKKEMKMRPYIYKSKYFTKKLLIDFIDISREVNIMSDYQFEKAVEFQKYPLENMKFQTL